jgi:flagellar motor switch protein FliM
MAGDELLSDGELDALMESVDDSGNAPAGDDGEFRRFDFTSRERSMLAELSRLPGLLERQAEMLAQRLQEAFGLEFSVTAEPAELVSVADVLVALERHVALTSAAAAPMAAPVFVVSPAPLLSFVVNQYFGGGRSGLPDPSQREALTPSELRLAERIASLALDSLCSAWEAQLPLEVTELQTLGVPDRLEALPREDALLRWNLALNCAERESTVQIMLPWAPLEPFRERFALPRKQAAETTTKSDWESYFRRELPGISLELAGVLDSRPMSLAALLELETGAVIPIEAPRQVRLCVDQVTLAAGRYGTFEGNKAVQLERLASVLRGAGQ